MSTQEKPPPPPSPLLPRPQQQYRKKLGMIGLGRLGLSIALSFERKGFQVFGYDISLSRIEAVRERILDSREPGVSQLLAMSKELIATSTLGETLQAADVIYISVATPCTISGEFDCEIVSQVLFDINTLRVSNKHIVICSTVNPQFIDQVGKDLLRDCAGTSLSYLPDGAIPLSYGSLLHHITRPEIVLIGQGSEEAGDYLEWIHMQMIDTPDKSQICRMSPTSAEIAKLASSSFAAVKISFANLMTQITKRATHTTGGGDGSSSADTCDVLRTLQRDPRFGRAFLKEGMGFGGPCIPRDHQALKRFALDLGVNADLLQSAQTMNQVHAEFMADMLMSNAREDGRITIENVAFREGCASDLIDESRKLEVARILAKRGYSVLIRDRQGIIDLVRKRFGTLFEYQVATTTAV